ncbi:biotin/lipoate A/B protein ligase family protein [Marinomonas posidonica]|uniref:lipoate--protein ligase family protein n=1 Tax=Marinomonas posidonica TaxID=936476 RepID=UPI0037351B7B
MDKNKHRIVQLTNSSVEQAFEKEAELIGKIQSGDLSECLLLWQTSTQTVVFPASNKWQNTPELLTQLKLDNWHIVSRRTGGAPVPQVAGVINLSHIYLWTSEDPYSIQDGYQKLCNNLQKFLNRYGLTAQIHATPYSYCDGDYNMNIEERKLVGTAQRIITAKSTHKVILAQACILVNASLEQLIKPINLSNKMNQIDDPIKADAHTCLADHLDPLPSIQELYQGLIQAFVYK